MALKVLLKYIRNQRSHNPIYRSVKGKYGKRKRKAEEIISVGDEQTDEETDSTVLLLKQMIIIGAQDNVGESLTDTYQDLSVYGIIAQIVQNKKWGK